MPYNFKSGAYSNRDLQGYVAQPSGGSGILITSSSYTNSLSITTYPTGFCIPGYFDGPFGYKDIGAFLWHLGGDSTGYNVPPAHAPVATTSSLFSVPGGVDIVNRYCTYKNSCNYAYQYDYAYSGSLLGWGYWSFTGADSAARFSFRIIGGGGGGGSGCSSSGYDGGGGGGGGGGQLIILNVALVAALYGYVGEGGAGGLRDTNNNGATGADGGNTVLSYTAANPSALAIAYGGNGGLRGAASTGAALTIPPSNATDQARGNGGGTAINLSGNPYPANTSAVATVSGGRGGYGGSGENDNSAPGQNGVGCSGTFLRSVGVAITAQAGTYGSALGGGNTGNLGGNGGGGGGSDGTGGNGGYVENGRVGNPHNAPDYTAGGAGYNYGAGGGGGFGRSGGTYNWQYYYGGEGSGGNGASGLISIWSSFPKA